MARHRSHLIAAAAALALIAQPCLPQSTTAPADAQPQTAVAPSTPAADAQPTSAVAPPDSTSTPAATTPPATSTPPATDSVKADYDKDNPAYADAGAKPAAAKADADDDDDDDTPAAPLKPGEKPAPPKKGIFGPKKLPYCKPGQDPGKGPVKTCRIKLPKMTPVSITDGTLTVDGMIAKVGLNYQIADLKYLYFWVPGTGIVIVTDKPFGAAKEQVGAFHSKGLTVNVNGQTIELFSENMLLKKDKKPLSAWVLLDPTLTPPVADGHFKSPNFGWGVTPGQPYTWPGSAPEDPKKHALAPPVPVNLRPIIAKPVAISLGATQPAKPAAATPATATPSTPSASPTTSPTSSTPSTSPSTSTPAATPSDSIPPATTPPPAK